MLQETKWVGIVTKGVIRNERGCEYAVTIKKTEYTIVTKGLQAVKDFVFIRKGQKVVLKGIMDNQTIYATKCKIIIIRDGEENEIENT